MHMRRNKTRQGSRVWPPASSHKTVEFKLRAPKILRILCVLEVLAQRLRGPNHATLEDGYLQVNDGVFLVRQPNETRCYKQASSETCHDTHS